MKEIKKIVSSEIIIEKSRFITYLLPIKDESDATNLIKEYQKKYNDATHVVYAYRLNLIERSNDDNEPKGTAGIPTLEVLRKEDLINILAITIRYFGGIKLGAGGLLRAYVNSLTTCLKNAEFKNEVKTVKYKLILSYKDASYFDAHFTNYIELNKDFSGEVTYILLINKEYECELMELLNLFNSSYKLELIKEETLFI